MVTQGEFVSSIINDLKLTVKDTWISKRHVLSVGKSKAKMLLAQRADEMKLSNAFDIISTIDCFEMEEVDVIKCDFIEIKNCNTLYKSVKKLPETIFGRSAIGIISVTTVDDSRRFEWSTPTKINNRGKLRKSKKSDNLFFFIENDHLYVTSDVETVKIRMIAINEEELEDCDCNKKETCKSAWDMKFPIIDLLYEHVRSQTLQELLSTFVQIPKDENPNLDEQQRGATVR